MVINIIHDPTREDRKVLLESEIIEHRLEVRLWQAIKDPVMRFRGIALAHKQIVRWARDNKMPMVCIGEDDLQITGPGCWEYFLRNIPTDFDMYLSGIYFGKVLPDSTVKDFCALHLYIVHERFYDCFLGTTDTGNLDRCLAGRGKYVVCNPFCAKQRNGWSDNKQAFKAYDYLLSGREICCGIDLNGDIKSTTQK